MISVFCTVQTMEEYHVRIFNGTYAVEAEAVRIDLFGRTKSGRSITLRYRGFFPYFYIVSPDAHVEEELRDDPDVVRQSMKILYVDNVKRDCLKVEIKRPFSVPNYRSRYKNRFKILAADIPFIQRFYYDLNLGSAVKVLGERVTNGSVILDYTTDEILNVEMMEAAPSFRTNLKTLSFDLENSIRGKQILCLCCAIREVDKEIRYEVLEGDEREIITEFIDLVIREDPDILTGYNIENYDIPYIIRRMRENGMGDTLNLGRNRSPMSHDKHGGWGCKGRVVIDAWKQVKKEKRPKRETLAYVSMNYLGIQKLDVDSSRMDEEWAKDPEKVIRYCKRDAELPILLLEKLGIIQKNIDIAQVSRLPLNDVINGRTSTLIDSILIREADRRNIGVPMTLHSGNKESVTGGYVHKMSPGLFHWLCVLDFKSMYPSIIIANNICFTTLSPQGKTLAPNGARFLSRERKEGILPDILQKLMKDRELAKEKSNNAGSDDEREYYEGFQNAIKILMNAFYGVFASNFYRFTDKSIGGAITSFARSNITRIIDELENERAKVLYSDTDSIFVQSPFNALDTTKAFGRDLAKRYSKEGAVLEFEKILETFFAHGAKKRYVGKVIWPAEGLLVRGYEIRRSDSFDLLIETLEEVFAIILTPGDEEIAGKSLKLIKEVISKTRQGEIDPEKLIISKTVQKKSHYKNPERMANVQAMMKLKAMNHEFTPGMKVSYIVTNGKITPQEVEPVIDEQNITIVPDWDYYTERLARALARITEVFGYDKKYLMDSIYQKSIDMWASVGESPQTVMPNVETSKDPSEAEKEHSLLKKKSTLLDFM